MRNPPGFESEQLPLRRQRRCLSLLLVLAPWLATATAAEAKPPRAGGPSTNVLEFVTHVRNARGVVRCGLFERKGWLTVPVRQALAKPSGSSALCVFPGIAEGVDGLSAFHDENENGKLDTNFLGMPVEDYCASRNARGTFGPPSFDDARFTYKGGTKRLEARMK
jgi:uncharacterized protein (DUF2141 family)